MSTTRENTSAIGSPQETTAAKLRDRGPVIVVLLVWFAMLSAALVLVAIYGSNVPSWDDWDMVPAVTGHQPVTFQWLWSQHNEHRVPVPRLAYLALMHLIALDFRVGMYFNVLATAALALAMVLTIRRVRGHSSYFDSFVPVVLLNWSQGPSFLWCWQVQFYASMLLAGVVLILVVRTRPRPKLSLGMTIGICLCLLPLCGANGVGLVPALALWVGYTAFLYWSTGTFAGRRDAVILGLFAGTAILLVSFYFIGYHRVPYHPSTHNPLVMLKTATQFLTMGFGPGVVGLSFIQRSPMRFWSIICAAVTGLFLLTSWMLLTIWRKQPDERPRAAGLLLFLVAMASLAVGLSMRRDGFEIRYVTLSVPALCAVYFVWSLYGAPRLQNAIRAILLATALIVLVPNTLWGLRYARDLRTHLAAFEADMAAGLSPSQLIHRHADYLHPHHLVILDYLPMLREGQVGTFRQLRDDPVFQEISLPLAPVELHAMEWDNGVARATAANAWLTFELPEDVQTSAIRLRYTYSNHKGTEPYLAIYWKSSDQPDFSEGSYSKYSPTGDRANWKAGTWTRLGDEFSTVYVAVSHPVKSVRLRLRFETGTMKIHELTLLALVEGAAQ